VGRLRVVYILGMGRSGSTLLDRLLSQQEGTISLGEASNIWRNGVLEDRTCACGASFTRCDFWHDVARASSGALSLAPAQEVVRFHDRHLDTRRMWRMLTAARRREVADAVPASYLDTVRRVYEAIAAVSGATTIVDSSKHPVYAFLLTLVPGLQVDLVHLVRDPRAVAHSWARNRIEPGTNPPTLQHRYCASQSGVLYTLYNVAAHRVAASSGGSRAFLRYEDFVERPSAILEEILGPGPDRDLNGEDPDALVEVKGNHSLSGNPMRFVREKTVVQIDDEWRARLPSRDRRLVETLTLPLALRYRYLPVMCRGDRARIQRTLGAHGWRC